MRRLFRPLPGLRFFICTPTPGIALQNAQPPRLPGTTLRLGAQSAARYVRCVLGVLVAILIQTLAIAQTATAPANQALSRPLFYVVSMADARTHVIHVRMSIPASVPRTPALREIQLPAWNALYQVRDFGQYVRVVTARDSKAQPLSVRKLDKSTWQIAGAPAQDGIEVEYNIVADTRGPFGAQVNEEHAFLNLAEILMYPVGMRDAHVGIDFTDVPPGWQIATALQPDGRRPMTFSARNYDQLVDSPVEIGTFQEISFQEGGATYRIVAHGNAADYNLDTIVTTVRKIVAGAVDWMGDRPFDQYLFIYHLPRGPAGGGMEHAYSTAIDVSADRLRDSLAPLEGVTAHEFFHLWNVKRIRPASLEPVDYTKENYTRALWFSEGVDSAVTQYILLNAGLRDEKAFLENLGAQIRELQRRPAHLTQSAEESSLDAWLEKYGAYNQPQRSVNYYNKGELLGYLLDLAVRRASQDRASLRDVFRWMNEHYAKQGRFFPDSSGVQQAAEAVSGQKLDWFFQKYVAGVEELPYDELLATVGLRVDRRRLSVADLGFTMTFGGEGAVVTTVVPGGPAQVAGLREGDVVLSINDRATVGRMARSALTGFKPGDAVKVKARGGEGEREINFSAGSREEEQFAVVDVNDVTPDQRARRRMWLASETRSAAKAARQSPVDAGLWELVQTTSGAIAP